MGHSATATSLPAWLIHGEITSPSWVGFQDIAICALARRQRMLRVILSDSLARLRDGVVRINRLMTGIVRTPETTEFARCIFFFESDTYHCTSFRNIQAVFQFFIAIPLFCVCICFYLAPKICVASGLLDLFGPTKVVAPLMPNRKQERNASEQEWPVSGVGLLLLSAFVSASGKYKTEVQDKASKLIALVVGRFVEGHELQFTTVSRASVVRARRSD